MHFIGNEEVASSSLVNSTILFDIAKENVWLNTANMSFFQKLTIKEKYKNRYVAIGAGGTGGHVFPAIAVAKKLIEHNYRVLFFTDKRSFEYIKQYSSLLNNNAFTIVFLTSKNAPRWKQFFMIIRDLWRCRFILTERVSLCIGFGGLVSFPVILFGILTFKITIIHEANAVMGLANRLLLPFVRVCLTSFEETKKIPKKYKKTKIINVGMPIRDEIKKYVYNQDNPSVNYRMFYKIEDIINITIFGGSQASDVFDKIIPQAITLLPNHISNKLHIIHQCRKENCNAVAEKYANANITAKVAPFFNNVGDLMRQSHLMIARAGSSCLAEITSLGVPSILIPLPSAKDNHQYENAKCLSNNNGAMLIEQNTLTPERLCEMLKHLLEHDALLYEMSVVAKKYSSVYADLKILAVINRCLGYEEDIEISSNLANVRYINDNVGLG